MIILTVVDTVIIIIIIIELSSWTKATHPHSSHLRWFSLKR